MYTDRIPMAALTLDNSFSFSEFFRTDSLWEYLFNIITQKAENKGWCDDYIIAVWLVN
jgi:hypothetical protein